MRKLLLVLLISLCFAPVNAIDITIEVDPVIVGNTFYVQQNELLSNAWEYALFWENFGSTGCVHQLRLDTYNPKNRTLVLKPDNRTIDHLDIGNQQDLVTTIWSAKTDILPGASEFLSIPLYLKENGTYVIQPRVYTCNEYFELEPVTLHANNRSEVRPLSDLGSVAYTTTKESIVLELEDFPETVSFIGISFEDRSREISISSMIFNRSTETIPHQISIPYTVLNPLGQYNVTTNILAKTEDGIYLGSGTIEIKKKAPTKLERFASWISIFFHPKTILIE